jgi:heterodisulfide reductase subunit A2
VRTGVYLCSCGTNVSERLDFGKLAQQVSEYSDVAFVKPVEFLCSEDGQRFLEADLRQEKPERVVIAACSPREYESTFMRVLASADMNPYFLQIANIREQVAWVTEDPQQASDKACVQIRAAIARVSLHRPLERKQIEACRDVLVIGAGPAGLKSALTLAEAGRKVILVEKSPALGGLPVRFEDLFPNMECGPCMLEPVLGEVFHGPYAENIEILTMAEVFDVAGYYGNFTVKMRQVPRYVDCEKCIGCGECIAPCPVVTRNEFNCGLNERKAIALPFPGALPNVPFLDESACLRSSGKDCTLCRDACPVEDTIRYDDSKRIAERNVGAIVVAVGADLYDCRKLPGLGYGEVPGVYTSLEFERILASNGPTGGALASPEGTAPESVAIIHCAGSLDPQHRPYCSGICCEYAFKFNHLVEKKLPGTKIHHFYKELVMPGKEGYTPQRHAHENPNATFVRYASPSAVRVVERSGKAAVEYKDVDGKTGSVAADIVVVCPAVTGAESAEELSPLLDASRDRFGFFEELHGRLDSAQSKIKGIYLAGACQAPMDIQQAISQGMAAAGYILSGLAEGKRLEIEPITASVMEQMCSRCRTCGAVCPYKAISYPADRESAYVNALLCHGCGTCVAACPAGAIQGNHFTNDQIFAEIEAILQ